MGNEQEAKNECGEDNVAKATGYQRGGVTGKGWLPGQSGNPAGKPVGTFSFKTKAIQYLEAHPELVANIINDYVTNEKRRQLLIEQIDGKAKQSTELTGKDGEPITLGIAIEFINGNTKADKDTVSGTL